MIKFRKWCGYCRIWFISNFCNQCGFVGEKNKRSSDE